MKEIEIDKNFSLAASLRKMRRGQRASIFFLLKPQIKRWAKRNAIDFDIQPHPTSRRLIIIKKLF